MSQTPLSNSPIFNQLVDEFAAKGAVYDEFMNWSTPEFEWDPSRPVIQLDKQKTSGIRLTKDSPVVMQELSESSKRMVEEVKKLDTFGREASDPLPVKSVVSQVYSDLLEAHGMEMPVIRGLNPRPNRLSEHMLMQELVKDSTLLWQEYVTRMGEEFAETHPLAVITDMHTEFNKDGSATIVFDGVQPITSVMPLSERNTAQPME